MAPVERSGAHIDQMADFLGEVLKERKKQTCSGFLLSFPCVTQDVLAQLCRSITSEQSEFGTTLVAPGDPTKWLLVLRGALAVAEPTQIEQYVAALAVIDGDKCPEHPKQRRVTAMMSVGELSLQGDAMCTQHAVVSSRGGLEMISIDREQLQTAVNAVFGTVPATIRTPPSMRQPKERHRVYDILHSVQLPPAVFAGLATATRTTLLSHLTVSTLEVGDVVVNEHKGFPGLIVLLSGSLTQMRRVRRKSQVLIEPGFVQETSPQRTKSVTLLPGTVMGPQSLLKSELSDNTVVAAVKSEVMILSAHLYKQCVQEVVTIGCTNVMRLVEMNNQIAIECSESGGKQPLPNLVQGNLEEKLRGNAVRMLRQQVNRDECTLLRKVLLPILDDEYACKELCKALTLNVIDTHALILPAGELCETLRLVVAGAAVTHSTTGKPTKINSDSAPNRMRYTAGEFINSWPFACFVTQTDACMDSAQICCSRVQKSNWKKAQESVLQSTYTGDILPTTSYPSTCLELIEETDNVPNEVQKKSYAGRFFSVVAEGEVTCIELTRHALAELTAHCMAKRLHTLTQTTPAPDDVHYVLSFLHSRSDFWKSLKLSFLFDLSNHATVKYCLPGEVICVHGEAASAFYCVL